MAVKRNGLGKGLDSLIPENKSVKPDTQKRKKKNLYKIRRKQMYER